MKKVIATILLLPFFVFSFSQTFEERKIIQKEIRYDKEKILIEKLNTQKKEREERFAKAGVKKSAQLKTTFTDGTIIQIKDILKDGTIIYNTTYNYGGVRTIRADYLHPEGSLGLDLDGENMIAGIWDGGLPRITHNEFQDDNGNPRITSMDQESTVSDHTSHVTGTIIAVGKNSKAKGVAYKAGTMNWDFLNDALEMTDFASQGYLVSNHSYGNHIEEIPIWLFGAYNEEAANMDEMAYIYPKYQIVKAPGNDRVSGPYYNPDKNGYELITGFSNSKNIITVAAVNQLLVYREPSSVVMSRFSNFGPTDDGRVKPNISAKGVDVYSTGDETDYAYTTKNGTSMAAPSITGAILLLQQHYKNTTGSYMNSATVRGLIQHTALEAGNSDGPDYRFGWGLANMEEAAKTITDTNNGSIIEENVLNNQEVYKKEISVSGNKPLIVSISWTDPAGPVNTEEIVDWEQKSLVNDLDLRITDEMGNVHFPWKLNATKYTEAATKEDNDIDNFERIDIPKASGKYTITITHKGMLVDEYGSTTPARQDYTLIVTGTDLQKSSIENYTPDFIEAKVYPNPVKDIMNISTGTTVKFSIYTVSGKLLISDYLNKGMTPVNISFLQNGIYLLKLENNNSVKTLKIIKE